MLICSSCGKEDPPEASFCMACATPIGALTRPVAEERKIVTEMGGAVRLVVCGSPPPSDRSLGGESGSRLSNLADVKARVLAGS